MVFKKKRFRKGDIGKHKFCPVCGTKLEIEDAYCTNCQYSFMSRKSKKNKKIKWRNVLILIVILVAIYLGTRYFNGQPIIPISIADIFNFSTQFSPPGF